MRAVARAWGLYTKLGWRQWGHRRALCTAKLHNKSYSHARVVTDHRICTDSSAPYSFIDEYPFATRGIATSAHASISSVCDNEYKASLLAEYERQIVAGDLKPGDEFQKSRGMIDPLELVAEEIAEESILLYLDEFMERCVVHEIGSATNYRRLTAAEMGFYFIGPRASETLRKLFLSELDGEEARPTTMEVIMGRKLKVPLIGASYVYFQFHELYEMPLDIADFFGLFKSFRTSALDNVPIFGSHNRSSAYRFVTLVMYEHGVWFICSVEGSPKDFFEKVVTRADALRKNDTRFTCVEDANLLVDDELRFAKDRTMSRLTEMHSKEYLKEHAEAHMSNGNHMLVVWDA